MARTFKSFWKLCRREGVSLYIKGAHALTPKRGLERREYPPGQHVYRRIKISEYGLKLRETQKLKRAYGLSDRQFRRMFDTAKRMQGNTGSNLLQLMERRLMSVVATLGFAPTMNGARQMVAHGHVLVNGRKMSIPSYLVKLGDVVTVHGRERSQNLAKRSIEVGLQGRMPAWIERSEEPPTGKVVGMPTRDDVSLPVNENLVVEYCSR
ncbi:MAG: 30S ribosomal protein S4 [Planctomycetota bacterium]|jgi:small subunit ribosomal protein S4